MTQRICTYWQGDPKIPAAFRADWLVAGFEVDVFDESFVSTLLKDINPQWQALFDRIRLPACRSDMARLVLLHQYGGMYIDCHGSPGERRALDTLFAVLETHELVMFINGTKLAEHGLHVFNGTILARQSCEMLRVAIAAGFDNLLKHYRAEATIEAHVPYNLAVLTGGWMIGSHLLNVTRAPFPPLAPFSGRIHRELLPPTGGHPGFRWYRHYGYRTPGQHWSERQQTERLFNMKSLETTTFRI